MNYEMDISLYGDSLKQWNEWISSLQQQEWLIRWAMRANKVAITVSMPVWMIARVIGIPLMVLSSCNTWTRVPASRPILLLFVPIVVILSMILISLIPYEPDIRDTKHILCELWPLSQRRLEWIAAHGTGKKG